MKEIYKEKQYQFGGPWKCPRVYQPLTVSRIIRNIDRACEIVGNAAALSKVMGFGHQSIVNKWKERGGCPPKDAWRIEIVTLGEVLAQDVCREPIYRNKF